MKNLRNLVKQTLLEFVTSRDLKAVELYADELFSDVGVDVEFTRHFLDRVNDPRNGIDITPDELKILYKKAHDKYANMISKLRTGEERVLVDKNSQINVPVAINGSAPDMEMIGKTVMRKRDFQSYTPKLQLEDEKPNLDLKFVEQSRGSHSGQHDLTAFATLDGIVIAYVDFSIFENEIHIEMVEVVEELKRHGIATKLFNFIRLKNPGMKIVPGYSTEEGSKFYKNYEEKYKGIEEDINVPINVGDTVLGGKFKNKKIIVKDIDKNEKGDVTINDKPLLRVRIPNK